MVDNDDRLWRCELRGLFDAFPEYPARLLAALQSRMFDGRTSCSCAYGVLAEGRYARAIALMEHARLHLYKNLNQLTPLEHFVSVIYQAELTPLERFVSVIYQAEPRPSEISEMHRDAVIAECVQWLAEHGTAIEVTPNLDEEVLVS